MKKFQSRPFLKGGTARAAIFALASVAALAAPAIGVAGHGENEPQAQWENAVRERVGDATPPVVQERAVRRAERFQLVGPLAGMSDRRDYYVTPMVSVAGRYHFTETHGWEVLRATGTLPLETDLAREARVKAGLVPDVQTSMLQASSAYVFTPVYGKYAWLSDSLVYFDIFGVAGAGARMATVDIQPFAEAGVGMNHYIWRRQLALTPEVRLRTYLERRTNLTLVLENTTQLGVSWLF